MEEKIMDTVEEITEEFAEPVEVIAEAAGKDWTKYGVIVGGVALVAAGAYGAYKLLPKAAAGVKAWKANRTEHKRAKKDDKYTEADIIDVEPVTDNEDNA